MTKLHSQFVLMLPIGIQAVLEGFADNLPRATHVVIVAHMFSSMNKSSKVAKASKALISQG